MSLHNVTLPAGKFFGKNRHLADILFVNGGKLLFLLFLIVALVMPLAAIFYKAFTPVNDQSGIANAVALFTSENFLWLLKNSVTVSVTVTLITLLLAYLFAYGLQRTCIPFKKSLRSISLLPLMAPSMLPGIALVYLFGNKGLLRDWLGQSIYGFWGIVAGEVIYTFPHALMILISSLSLADARLFDAAKSMGASSLKQFFTITWPGSRQGVFAAACLVFTLTITDFGVPVVVGGDYQVFALEAYKSVIGQQQFERGALIGIVLLVPALFSFLVDRWLRRSQAMTLSGRAQVYTPAASLPRDGSYLLLLLIISAALLLVFATAVWASFIQLWPYNLSFSLRHYQFDGLPGGWLAYQNSLILAFSSALLGTAVVFMGAYLLEKINAASRFNTLLRMVSFIPMAVPGLVLGLGYVFFFNAPDNPLNPLYGSMALLIICTVIHLLTTAQMTATSALNQLDNEFEAASLSLKVSYWSYFWRVTFPVCLPSVIDISRYLFVSAMTTVSAAIFLYSPDSILASIAVLSMDDAGNVGGAAAMSTLILFTSLVVSLLLSLIVRAGIKRTQQWRCSRLHH